MSEICKKCDVGISSTDYHSEDLICSSCLYAVQTYRLIDAEKIIKALIQRCDVQEASELAFEYEDKYLGEET